MRTATTLCQHVFWKGKRSKTESHGTPRQKVARLLRPSFCSVDTQKSLPKASVIQSIKASSLAYWGAERHATTPRRACLVLSLSCRRTAVCSKTTLNRQAQHVKPHGTNDKPSDGATAISVSEHCNIPRELQLSCAHSHNSSRVRTWKGTTWPGHRNARGFPQTFPGLFACTRGGMGPPQRSGENATNIMLC